MFEQWKTFLGIFQLMAARPRQLSAMSKRHKTVSRTYGGSLCHKCVRSRSVQALINVVHMVEVVLYNSFQTVLRESQGSLLVKCQARDQKVAYLNPGRSGREFSSRELTLCANSFSVPGPPPCYSSGM